MHKIFSFSYFHRAYNIPLKALIIPLKALTSPLKALIIPLKALIIAMLSITPWQNISANMTEALLDAAKERLNHSVQYDGAYLSIAYPGGDVPDNMGVCTDVIIRSYRGIGLDLQKLVHEDMKTAFNDYPSKRIWELNSTDRNIDHRRVPNLQTFFKRHGQKLPVTSNASDYTAGELVTWMLPGNLPHIGIVSDVYDKNSGHPLIIHNIGSGPQQEDMLFDYPITGHYRFLPENHSNN